MIGEYNGVKIMLNSEDYNKVKKSLNEQIDDLLEENNRLNNIIEELEKCMEEFVEQFIEERKSICWSEGDEDKMQILEIVLDKLKALKEEK